MRWEWPRHIALKDLALFILLCPLSFRGRAAESKPVDLKTAVHDVGDLIAAHASWRGKLVPSSRAPVDGAAAIVEVIVRSVDPDSWNPSKKGGPTIEITQGTKLEVRASAKQHEEIAGLLAVLRGLCGMAIRFEGEVHEVSKDFYLKQLKPLLTAKDFVGPVDGDLTDLVAKQKGRRRVFSVNLANPGEGEVYSRRQALITRARPSWEKKEDGDDRDVVFCGTTLRAKARASDDRRFIRMELTREVKEFIALREEKVVELKTGKVDTVEKLQLRTDQRTASLHFGDGVTFLIKVPANGLGRNEATSETVLLIRVTLEIEEENREMRNNKGK